ncbi:DEAD/DEAH box helicase family protein [Pseudomonas aeruginosa]|uniref:DEAD/DEAH box helicase family protein n=1 Tax=Pseudomonas aeruginosa TaxID=287 RepID=UPI0012490B04|nr:DEAD/DEAH box helicase family protein [Pseudomonas aeruginosa]KAB0772298.1 hypothetical protein F7P00_25795 [Pseudomonas aeruginosa]
MTKSIYAAIAAPGAGKTQTLINQLKNSVKSGEKVVIALPTLKLNQEIIGRMETAGLKPRVINSEETDGKAVSKVINGILQNGNECVILVTHEGILRSDPSFLKGYTLIFDEVPSVLELDHFALKLDEAREILESTEIIESQLKIKHGLVTKIKSRVNNYKASSSDRVLKSVLSQAEYKVFSTILNNNIVHIEQGKLEEKEVVHFHIISEKDYLPHINASKECHILAANIQGGLFDLLAKNAGVSYKKSKFTPEPFAYACDITIYPMLNKSWSKTQALKSDGGNRWDHQGSYDYQMIDKVLAAAIHHQPKEKFLVVKNNWAKFGPDYFPKDVTTEINYCGIDCRGIDSYKDKTAAVLLFSGKPSPNDQKSLKLLSEKHGIPLCEFIQAWTTKNKFEASLQAAARTAVRDRTNQKPVHLFVQDDEVAEYLKNTYMTDAIIDRSLKLEAFQGEDGRCYLSRAEQEDALAFIDECASKGMKRVHINYDLVRIFGLKPANARRWTKHLAPVKDKTHDLTQFFA